MKTSVAKLLSKLTDEGLLAHHRIYYLNGSGWYCQAEDLPFPLIFSTFEELHGYLKGAEQRRIYTMAAQKRG